MKDCCEKKRKAVSPEDEKGNKRSSPPPNKEPWEELVRTHSGKSIEIVNPSQAVIDALKTVGEDDPAVLLDWHFDAIARAADHANATTPPLPAWLAGIAYPISAEQLLLGISNTLAAAGGGQQLGSCLLAPNTDPESNRIFVRASYFMLADPFLANICAAPNQHPIARFYLLGDGRRPLNGIHQALPPLPPGHGVELFD